MRKEFFRYWSIANTVLGVPWGIFCIGMVIWFVPKSPNFNTLSARIAAGVAISLFAAFTIFAASIPWLKKWSKMRPLMIIDDAGLWLRNVGELMPWSGIQSIEWKTFQAGTSWAEEVTVTWKEKRYRLDRLAGALIDGDGKYWGRRRIYDEIKACWERYSDASVSADSNQIVPKI